MDEELRSFIEKLRERYDPQYADALLKEIGYGETVVGLENLYDNLLDDEVTLDPDLLDDIERLGRLWGLRPAKWERLRARQGQANVKKGDRSPSPTAGGGEGGPAE
jgi:hypothetical protein